MGRQSAHLGGGREVFDQFTLSRQHTEDLPSERALLSVLPESRPRRHPFALNAPGDWEEALSYFTEHRATLNLKLYVTDPSQPPGTPAIPGAGMGA